MIKLYGLPMSRASRCLWSIWGMTEVEPPVMKVLLNRLFLPEAQRDARVADAGEAELRKPLGVLDGALAKGPYLLGDAFTAADLNVYSILGIATVFGRVDLSPTPRAAAWASRCAARPALARATKRS